MTQGLLTRSGIIPCGYTQDVPGIIGRSIRDVAIGISVMASVGYDNKDNKTALGIGHRTDTDYAKHIRGDALNRTLRIGILDRFFSNNTNPDTVAVNSVMDSVVDKLSDNGVEFVHITNPIFNSAQLISLYDVQRFEFRQLLDEYFETTHRNNTNINSLSALLSSGLYFVDPHQTAWYNLTFTYSTNTPEYKERIAEITQNLTIHLLKTFADYNLSAIIYPQQQHLVLPIGSPTQSGRNGILAAVTGFPAVCIPAGFSSVSFSAPIGVPIGMEILGLPFTEGELLNLAHSINNVLQARHTPQLAHISVNTTYNLTTVPSVKPNSTLPSPYVLGPAIKL